MDKPNNFRLIYQKGGYKLKLFVVLVLLIFTIGAVFVTYTWQYNQVDNLNQKIDELNRQVTSSNSLVNKLTLQQKIDMYKSTKSVEVKVYSPASNNKIASPLAIIGQVPGSWSFEASFPVKLKDSNGKIVAQAPAQLLGDWMTNNLVPFSLQLTWLTAQSGNGTLVLEKDNPSGLSENDDSVSIPVKF
jgi:hypothetical protein